MHVAALALMLVALLTNLTSPAAGREKEHTMSEYTLILHETPSYYAGFSADEIHRIVLEYVAWKDKLKAEDRLVASNKLADEGGRRLVSDGGTVRVTDGPYVEAKEVVAGYFVVRAKDYDEAVEIARTCPHLAYGGTIEVRLIDVVRAPAAAGR